MPAVTVSSVTDICNLALSELGHFEISSFPAVAGDGKPGRLCNRFYVPLRNALMRSRNWNATVKRVDLAASTDEPAFEYTYSFPLPVDCLKVVRTEDESAGYTDDYRIEQGNLLSNSDTVAIEYLAAEDDVALYDALFVQVLAKQLAIAMCMPLTDNAGLKKALGEELRDILPTASVIDAQEGTPREFVVDTWILSRV